MNKYKGMNILLVTPFFYGYGLEIKKALQKYGLNVTSYFYDGYPKKFFYFRKREKNFINKNKNEIINLVKNQIFNYLLVINNSLLDSNIISRLVKKNKSLKSIILLWDSVKNIKWNDFENYLNHFEYRYSFDHRDCLEYSDLNLKHRPNFYHPVIDTLEIILKPKYEIASVMSAQPNRLRYINGIDNKYPDLKKSFYIHLNKFISIPAYIINHNVFIKPKYIKLNRLDIKHSLELLNNSESVLDIPANNQYGLPFRSIDSIGLKKKLITKNSDVLKYDFFHPDNVLIIQPEKIDAVKDFLNVPYRPLDESIREKYSLNFWIYSILSNENIKYLR